MFGSASSTPYPAAVARLPARVATRLLGRDPIEQLELMPVASIARFHQAAESVDLRPDPGGAADRRIAGMCDRIERERADADASAQPCRGMPLTAGRPAPQR